MVLGAGDINVQSETDRPRGEDLSRCVSQGCVCGRRNDVDAVVSGGAPISFRCADLFALLWRVVGTGGRAGDQR